MIKSFKEIIVWQKAHNLVLEVYNITNEFPRNEQFGLVSQMRRCSVSIPFNIAEGFKRKGQRDSAHFYNIAEGSLEELKYQLLLTKDLKFIGEKVYRHLEERCDEIGRLLNGWIKSQK